MATVNTDRPIVFFDGECNLCNGGVQFIIKHDRPQRFLFAPLQSAAGAEALTHIAGPRPDSMIVLDRGRYYTKSDASLQIARRMSGLWPLLYVGKIIPRFIRDGLYGYLAKNRYKWFGKRDACMIPTPELKARFLS